MTGVIRQKIKFLIFLLLITLTIGCGENKGNSEEEEEKGGNNCEPGYYVVSQTRCFPIQRDCLPCPLNHITTEENSWHCEKCPDGKITKFQGSSECVIPIIPDKNEEEKTIFSSFFNTIEYIFIKYISRVNGLLENSCFVKDGCFFFPLPSGDGNILPEKISNLNHGIFGKYFVEYDIAKLVGGKGEIIRIEYTSLFYWVFENPIRFVITTFTGLSPFIIGLLVISIIGKLFDPSSSSSSSKEPYKQITVTA